MGLNAPRVGATAAEVGLGKTEEYDGFAECQFALPWGARGLLECATVRALFALRLQLIWRISVRKLVFPPAIRL